MTTLHKDSNSELSVSHAYPLVRLYAHHDIPDGAKRGGVVMAGNLPEQTVASKAQYGIYPWPIGAECLAREFRTVKVVDGKRVHSEPVKGCPSCRTTPVVEVKPTTEVDELKMRIAELEEQLKAKKQSVSYECAECEFGSTTEHGLKIHMGQRHKKEKK